MPTPRITLDQWAALVAVVEQGGYGQASEHLHRTQSTVTYTIKKLEDQLGLKVFERQGRRAALTPAGQVLYRRGKSLLDDAARIERSAAGLAQGWEAEVRLAVDAIFPTWLLLRALADFGREHPDIRIELIEAVLGGVEEAITEGRVDFVIGTLVPGGFLGDALMQVRFVCAAAPSHPLHQLGRPVELEDLRAHRHLVVRDSGVRRSSLWRLAQRTALDRLEQGDVDPCGVHGTGLRLVRRGEHPRRTGERLAQALAADRRCRAFCHAVPRVRGPRRRRSRHATTGRNHPRTRGGELSRRRRVRSPVDCWHAPP